MNTIMSNIKNSMYSIQNAVSTESTTKSLNEKPIPTRETDMKELENIVKELEANPILNNRLGFSFDSDINQIMVKIYDKQTDEVIRQYPSEDFIKRWKFFKENILEGILLDKKI